jgi:hypothetical protein
VGGESPTRKYTPWALADAARVCLAYGTEHQHAEGTGRDLLEILAAYASLKELTLHGTDEPAVRLRDFMMRLSGEQMAWQAPEYVSLARTAALYLHTPFPARQQPRCMAPSWDTEVLAAAAVKSGRSRSGTGSASAETRAGTATSDRDRRRYPGPGGRGLLNFPVWKSNLSGPRNH